MGNSGSRLEQYEVDAGAHSPGSLRHGDRHAHSDKPQRPPSSPGQNRSASLLSPQENASEENEDGAVSRRIPTATNRKKRHHPEETGTDNFDQNTSPPTDGLIYGKSATKKKRGGASARKKRASATDVTGSPEHLEPDHNQVSEELPSNSSRGVIPDSQPDQPAKRQRRPGKISGEMAAAYDNHGDMRPFIPQSSIDLDASMGDSMDFTNGHEMADPGGFLDANVLASQHLPFGDVDLNGDPNQQGPSEKDLRKQAKKERKAAKKAAKAQMLQQTHDAESPELSASNNDAVSGAYYPESHLSGAYEPEGQIPEMEDGLAEPLKPTQKRKRKSKAQNQAQAQSQAQSDAALDDDFTSRLDPAILVNDTNPMHDESMDIGQPFNDVQMQNDQSLATAAEPSQHALTGAATFPLKRKAPTPEKKQRKKRKSRGTPEPDGDAPAESVQTTPKSRNQTKEPDIFESAYAQRYYNQQLEAASPLAPAVKSKVLQPQDKRREPKGRRGKKLGNGTAGPNDSTLPANSQPKEHPDAYSANEALPANHVATEPGQDFEMSNATNEADEADHEVDYVPQDDRVQSTAEAITNQSEPKSNLRKRVKTSFMDREEIKADPSTPVPGASSRRRSKKQDANAGSESDAIADSTSAAGKDKPLKKERKIKEPEQEHQGKFTPFELRNVDAAIQRWRSDNDLTEQEMINIIHLNPQKSNTGEFWDHVHAAVPQRKRQKIINTCRKKYHSFTARGTWTPEQHEELKVAYEQHGKHYGTIARQINRHPEDVRDRIRNYITCGDKLRKVAWDQEEEGMLVNVIHKSLDEIRALQNGDRPDLKDREEDELIDWNIVSEHMQHTRSRLQCLTKWKRIKAVFEGGSIDGVSGISMEERIVRARADAKTMTDRDLYKLLKFIKESKANADSRIAWARLRADFKKKWERPALICAWYRLRESVPSWKQMGIQEVVTILLARHQETGTLEVPSDEQVDTDDEFKDMAHKLHRILKETNRNRHKNPRTSSDIVKSDDEDDEEEGEGGAEDADDAQVGEAVNGEKAESEGSNDEEKDKDKQVPDNGLDDPGSDYDKMDVDGEDQGDAEKSDVGSPTNSKKDEVSASHEHLSSPLGAPVQTNGEDDASPSPSKSAAEENDEAAAESDGDESQAAASPSPSKSDGEAAAESDDGDSDAAASPSPTKRLAKPTRKAAPASGNPSVVASDSDTDADDASDIPALAP